MGPIRDPKHGSFQDRTNGRIVLMVRHQKKKKSLMIRYQKNKQTNKKKVTHTHKNYNKEITVNIENESS